MKKTKLIISALVAILILVTAFFTSNQKPQEAGSPVSEARPVQAKTASSTAQSSSTFKVARVVDGDTIELSNGQKIRYIGIDTPETVDPRKGVQCFGKEASTENKELVEGKEVKLIKDVSETDRYGRLLRYVYVGDTFVNDYLVRQGYAHATSYPPDVKYQDQFKEAEKEAREDNLGLWHACEK